MSHGWSLPIALYPLPCFQYLQWEKRTALDVSEWRTIFFSTELGGLWLLAFGSEALGARSDETTSSSACSTTWKKKILRPLFEFNQLESNYFPE